MYDPFLLTMGAMVIGDSIDNNRRAINNQYMVNKQEINRLQNKIDVLNDKIQRYEDQENDPDELRLKELASILTQIEIEMCKIHDSGGNPDSLWTLYESYYNEYQEISDRIIEKWQQIENQLKQEIEVLKRQDESSKNIQTNSITKKKDISEETHEKFRQEDKKAITIITVIIVITAILAAIICGSIFGIKELKETYNKKHHIGEFACPHCSSIKTEGFTVSWTNDGNIAKNESEAEYTYIKCRSCGYNWRYYLK